MGESSGLRFWLPCDRFRPPILSTMVLWLPTKRLYRSINLRKARAIMIFILEQLFSNNGKRR